MYDGYDLKDNSLSKGRNEKFIWAEPRLLTLLPQKRRWFEYRFCSEDPSSIARFR